MTVPDLSMEDLADEKHLEELGYKQELKRNVTFWGSVGITLGCMQPLLCSGVLFYGMGWGGPKEVVWGFIGCFLWSFFLALSMAEISSQYTVAGGPYYWAGALAGRLGRLPSYIQGWVLYLAFVGGMISYEFQIAQQAVSIRLILTNGALGTPPGALGDVSGVPFGVPLPNTPSSEFQRSFFGIMAGCVAIHSLGNFIPVRHVNTVAIVSFLWLMVVSAIMIIALPIIAPVHSSGSWVFTKSVPSVNVDTSASLQSTNLPTDGWNAMVGLLMAQYLLLVYDTPAHMSEETRNAARTTPRAIIFAYVAGGLLNLGMLLSYLFCVNLDNYQYDPISLEPLAEPDNTVAVGNFLLLGVTNGLFPVGNIFYDAFMTRYGRAEGAAAFAVFIFIGTNFCALLTITAAVRFLYSFARDGGLPFSRQLAYVEPRTGVPVNCVLLFCCTVILFQLGIFNDAWFSTINGMGGIVANGMLFAYGVPPLLRIINRHAFRPAKEFDLRWASIPCALIGALYCFFSVATICLPPAMPVTKLNLNVAPIFLGVVLLWALLSFPVMVLFNWYKGPALLHEAEDTPEPRTVMPAGASS